MRRSTAIHRGSAPSGQNSAAVSPPADVEAGTNALVGQRMTGASPLPTRAPWVLAPSFQVTTRPKSNAEEVAEVDSVRTESVSHSYARIVPPDEHTIASGGWRPAARTEKTTPLQSGVALPVSTRMIVEPAPEATRKPGEPEPSEKEVTKAASTAASLAVAVCTSTKA